MVIRQQRRSDDPFFADGDRVSLQDSQTIVIFYSEETQLKRQNDIGNNCDWNHDEGQECDSYESFSSSFPCYALQCSKVFDNLKECETHYLDNHTFECRVCNNFFPHDSILDLVSGVQSFRSVAL